MAVWAGDQNTHGMVIRFTDARGEMYVEEFKTFREWHDRENKILQAFLRQETITATDGRTITLPVPRSVLSWFYSGIVWARSDTYVPAPEKRKRTG